MGSVSGPESGRAGLVSIRRIMEREFPLLLMLFRTQEEGMKRGEITEGKRSVSLPRSDDSGHELVSRTGGVGSDHRSDSEPVRDDRSS